MQSLKDRIRAEATVIGTDILKVDHFLNHQVDVDFLQEVGQELYRHFQDEPVTKILTVEASGIAVAVAAAMLFHVPVVFAKKSASLNLDQDTYTSEVFSFTRQTSYLMKVSKRYLSQEDHVLIIDDFLANGRAVQGMIDIVKQAGASLAGVGIVIEKGFQEGGRLLRQQGIKVVSLAIIEAMDESHIEFREEQ
ncbi:MAG TPA: xanthine phosphoribosyltransferase [Syntrophomonadaceae bacterium]|nr:xanthine phosphoribosyltransferase [Syntrophomonadaceae bacterium]HOQ10599.1 xanthine phosphoribosyltransferase [Syntrophomonadaceae bacterium]HPU49737.1 xanthine phosphoribosyltransferase [Syntrophomonadaceae bacterium]